MADGRYRYKYVDELGKSRYVYSTRLVPNDPAVNGKKKMNRCVRKLRES